jgi:hypothetical protein
MLLLNSLRKRVRRGSAHDWGPRRLSGHHPRNRRLDIESLEDPGP